ncbi:MAG: hypothetical protein NC489_30615 [Ruminococcus flavefaciens]|nr:hypothetical protein [Ruminococcus flavefaciens]
MSLNIGKTPEEQKRIDRFMSMVGVFVNSDMVKDLQEKGFFIAPASIKYHGAYEGALFDHSYEVAKALVNLTRKLELPWERSRSPFIVGMFHDLCKMDDYIKSEDGVWEKRKDPILPGHGEKSVILLQKYMELTEEEIICIRWHMGAFDVKENWNLYGAACTRYPNVLYTHTADMIAARILGV